MPDKQRPNSGAFKPGQSGNPRGRPKKGSSFTEILVALGNTKDVTKGEKMITRKQALAEKLWQLALKGEGDLAAMKYLYDREGGRPEVTTRVFDGDLPQIVVEEVAEDDEE